VRALANLTKQRLALCPGLLLAVVAPGDLLFGLSRMWQANLDEECRAMVFRTRTEAQAWIEGELSNLRQ